MTVLMEVLMQALFSDLRTRPLLKAADLSPTGG